MTTARCLLALAASKGWFLHQMHVENDFLHGDLRQEIYMETLPGFPPPKFGYYCRLRKSIYGLQQAGRNWFAKLSSTLLHFDFQQSP